jgi:hypothetical protein
MESVSRFNVSSFNRAEHVVSLISSLSTDVVIAVTIVSEIFVTADFRFGSFLALGTETR